MVVELISQVLREAGLQVIQSFDLQAAITSHAHCSCPYHGTELCDCQMIVLLAYHSDQKPVTLVAHGKDGNTHIGILAEAGGDRSLGMEDIIRKAIVSIKFDPVNLPQWSDAT
jgi:hypothetical protein